MAVGAFFSSLDIRLFLSLGTTASTPPTSSSGMTEILSLTNAGISVSSDSTDVQDYSTDFGFKTQLVVGQSYNLGCQVNYDTTSEGYKILKQAAMGSATGVTVRWLRMLPLVGSTHTDPQIDAGVAFVSNWQESVESGSVAQCSFDLVGYGAPTSYQQGSKLATLTITTAGSGLTAGTGIALVSESPAQGNGSGLNGTATITLTGGAVSGVTVVAPGTNYRVGDILTITDPAVVGAGDVAPRFTVSTVV